MDYSRQEASSTHLQDIAIRRSRPRRPGEVFVNAPPNILAFRYTEDGNTRIVTCSRAATDWLP